MPRLYVDADLAAGHEIRLPDAAAHHVRGVLRLARDAELVLFDGRGAVHEARLTTVARDGVVALIGRRLETSAESPLDLTLVQAVSRGERMDYTLQKSVELGVKRIVPVISRRTVVRLDARRAHKRREHWLGVVRHAAEQSGRSLMPALDPVQPLESWTAAPGPGSRIVLDPRAAEPLARRPPPRGPVTLVAGPEGGFEDLEMTMLERAGTVRAALGPRILRTETAAVCALAVMQALWGDLA